MNSDPGNGCSHPLGFPIRKSPDHSLLAAPRSLSQLTTSFFAFLRLGIHTHALSSLTITSTSYTNLDATSYLCSKMPVKYSIVKDLDCHQQSANSQVCELLIFGHGCTRMYTDKKNSFVLSVSIRVHPWLISLVGPDGIEPSTSPLSGVRSSHLSYGPR